MSSAVGRPRTRPVCSIASDVTGMAEQFDECAPPGHLRFGDLAVDGGSAELPG